MKTVARATRRRITIVIAVGLVVSACSSSHGSSSSSSAQPVTGSTQAVAAPAGHSGGVLTVGEDLSGSINPIEFDPAQFTGPAGFFSYDWPIYAGLLRETTSGAYVPDLASAVTVPDPSTLDIQICPGLTYSNGAPLDAAAVKAGYARNLTDPRAGAWNTAMYQISAIDVTGADSLVMHFSQPVAATFYPLLADQESFMALPTGSSTGAVNTNMVGAGPFVLKSYTPDERIVLVKNPHYWDAASISLAGITFINVPFGPQQLNALESGLIDVGGIPNNDLPALKGLSSSIQTASTFADANYTFTPICKASGPLANLMVRQALNYATNRTAINDALLFGQGEPAWSIFPSSSVFYDKSLTNYYAYNPTKAKQLLAEAGYPNGFSTTLMALPEPALSQLATVLQTEWKQIGVSVQIVPTSNYVTDLYRDNKAQLGLNPQGLPGIGKLTTQYIPGNVGDLCGYNDPTLNAINTQIQAQPPNSPQLISAWQAAEDFVVKNALSVYIDFTPLVTGASKAVTNLQVVPYVGGVLNYWVVGLS
jgi:peptide/nickel transport system substrate-binding protein